MKRTLALWLFLAAGTRADEIELLSGTVIEGKTEDLGDSVKVTRSGGSVVYPKSMIRKITPKKTVEELYQERTKELKAEDVEGRLKLARWCLERKLQKEAVAEYGKVLAAAPDHEEARLGAGFRKLGDQWVTEEAWFLAKGLVRHKGRWITPEERDLDVAIEEQKDLEKALADKIRVQLERMKSGDPKKRAEAAAELERIDDKHKAKAYVAAISSLSEHVRRLVFEELGRMKEPAAAKPLVRRSLWDPEEDLRAAASAALKAIAHPDTALFHVPFLAEESVSARIRCVDQMAAFRDRRVAPVLVEALENSLETEKAVMQYGEQMTAMMNRQMVLRDGSRITLPTVVRIKPDFTDKAMKAKLDAEQASILSTLSAITGENHGEDVPRWRAALAAKKTGN
ncbi:MAG TPA: HEAT repeat domain-containing protein [Planctomycetota bacterium]